MAGPPFRAAGGGIAYEPRILSVPNPSVQGKIYGPPYGVILHGSRGGAATREAEWEAMQRYAASGADGMGWNVTVYDDAIALHMPTDSWGWHARSYSPTWLGLEFVQPTADDDITDGQVRAAAWWLREMVDEEWPGVQLEMLAHSEVKPGIADGKTDVFRIGDPRLAALKARILAEGV